jgi:hypothetical protein
LAAVATVPPTGGGLAGADPAQAATSLPCDIYAAGGTPCVAAHSTTRRDHLAARHNRVSHRCTDPNG